MIFPFYAFWTPIGFVRWVRVIIPQYPLQSELGKFDYLSRLSYAIPPLYTPEKEIESVLKVLSELYPNESYQHFLSIRYPTE
jgi:hypothetical protein